MSEPTVPIGLVWSALFALGGLLFATAWRLSTRRGQSPEESRQRIASLKSWWCVAFAVLAASFWGTEAIVVLMAAVSLLSINEFVYLGSDADRTVGAFDEVSPHSIDTAPGDFHRSAIAVTLGGYVLLVLGQTKWFVSCIPLAAWVVPSFVVIAGGQASGALAKTARFALMILLLTYALGHTVLLACLPPESNLVAGPAGWFLYLLAITQINDIAQALVGRRWGRRGLTAISPGKTWEGFLGGAAIAMLVAVGASLLLTPLSMIQAILSGLIISLAGLLGDLNMSMIKRDRGVKDSGTLIPGQGGMLDRIDSLTFAAPAFYYYLQTTRI